MNKYINIILLTVLGFLFAGCCSNNAELAHTIKHLGIDNNFFETMSSLEKQPRLACKYLIAELHIVPVKHINGYDKDKDIKSMHVIWCLRALRALTGKKFYSKTSESLCPIKEKNRIYWLYREHKDQIPFFATWMSRDSIYIAPTDVQKDIIRKWKEWYSFKSNGYNYRKFRKSNLEYFYF